VYVRTLGIYAQETDDEDSGNDLAEEAMWKGREWKGGGGKEERQKERKRGKEEIRETGVYHLGISLALVRPPRHPYINITRSATQSVGKGLVRSP